MVVRLPRRLLSWLSLLCLAAALSVGGSATAQGVVGDLDGNGEVDASDETLLVPLYGSRLGEDSYDAAGDLDGNGVIDVGDLALFGALFGGEGGASDETPPGLFVTLNDIPNNMNDLLVAPPDAFQITLHFDSLGGSLIDPQSLVVTSALDMGPIPGGTNLAPQFAVLPSRAVWEVPFGSDLARTTHSLDVSVRDLAGNEAQASYQFAVRDFVAGPPLGNLQTIFLDFDQDRSLGPEIDFLEDLREFGLSSPEAPQIEALIRDSAIAEILARAHAMYGRNADGSPGPDAVNLVFTATDPGVGSRSRLCVGGQSSAGPSFLGSATLDMNNLVENSDECATSPQFGIFPNAIDDLWSSGAEYVAVFSPLDPDLGGIPIGEHVLDASIAAPGFDPNFATLAQRARLLEMLTAFNAFAQIVATAVAHETGHMLGLTAPGPAPAGLYGGTSGGQIDHNVTPGGINPPENFIMNSGGSFKFKKIAGRAPEGPAVFRPLNWAYLRDRITLNPQVTGLYPPPTLTSVSPNPAAYAGGNSVALTFEGTDFLDPPLIELLREGDPTPDPVFNVTVVDPQTVTGSINRYFVPPGIYAVRFVNGDGQEAAPGLTLEVQP